MRAAQCIMHEQSSDPKHIAEQIAEAIVDHLHTHGQCSIMDVKAMGFSLNDIARNWPDACKIAERVNSKWRILND